MHQMVKGIWRYRGFVIHWSEVWEMYLVAFSVYQANERLLFGSHSYANCRDWIDMLQDIKL